MQQTIEMTADRIVRLPEVKCLTGLSRATIYQWMKDGKFPVSICLGGRVVGWKLSDIQAFINSRPVKAAAGGHQ